MKGTFEFNLKDGRTCTLEAEYECKIAKSKDEVSGKTYFMKNEDFELSAYVDGEKFGDSTDLYDLVDASENYGIKVIWGLGIGFYDKEDAERYEKWIAEFIESEKTDEVKAYEEENKICDIVDDLDFMPPVQTKLLLS